MASFSPFGSFGRPTFYTPWAQRMLQALEGFGPAYARRLRGPRREGSNQRILALEVTPGRILAQIADRWGDTQQVRIISRTMPDEIWQRVADILGHDPGQLTALLSPVPRAEMQSLFVQAGGWLFPRQASDLEVICTCSRQWEGQWEGLCAHAAAALLAFCSRLESQPGLLLTLWGRPVERLVEQVQGCWHDLARRADDTGQEGERHGLPASVRASAFYCAGPPLPEQDAEITPPQIETALLARMGPPPFAVQGEDLATALAPLYRYVTRRAIQVWERSAPATTRRRRTHSRWHR